ncbi:MAG: DUF262 domain-containing protein [Flavobacteriales bacterium]|nr:DUF262 domain-containing protein [Flavobacteriales bacterium]
MGTGSPTRSLKFQRDYSWTGEQWDDLWQGHPRPAERRGERPLHGLPGAADHGQQGVPAIDGQQRLTTLSIMVLATLKRLNDLVERGVTPTTTAAAAIPSARFVHRLSGSGDARIAEQAEAEPQQ